MASGAAAGGLALLIVASGANMAQADPLPPLPGLSSLLGSGIGVSGETAADAAGIAGAAGGGGAVVAAAAPLAIGAGLVGAGYLAWRATAGLVSPLVKFAGVNMCAGGTFLGDAYGQDCSAGGPNPLTPAQQNVGATGSSTAHLCQAAGSYCFTVDVAQQVPVAQYGATVYYAFPVTVESGDPSGATIYLTPAPGGDAGIGNIGSVTSQTKGGSNLATGYFVDYSSNPSALSSDAAAMQAANCITLAGQGGCNSDGSGPVAGYGQDTISRVTTTTANPARYLESTVTFTDGSTASCKTAQFYETDALIPNPCAVPNPSNLVPAHLVVREWLADGSASTIVSETDTSGAYQSAATAYPDCAAGACSVQVYVRGVACSIGAQACVDWIHQDAAANSITCEYGPADNPTEYGVPLSECNVLAPYYDPQAQAAGQPYANPKTGAPVNAPTAKPAGGTSITASSQGKDCFGNVYGTFDPLGWVTRPVECAMQAMFQPDATNIATKQETITDQWQDTELVKTGNAVVGVFQLNPPESDCSGFHIDLSPIFSKLPGAAAGGDHTINVANACEEPIKSIAAICNLALIVVFGVGGVIAVSRYIGRAVNFSGAGSSSDGDG